jgi:hypothetical protein
MPETETRLIAEDLEEMSWDQLVRTMVAYDPEETDGSTPMDSSSNACCDDCTPDPGGDG